MKAMKYKNWKTIGRNLTGICAFAVTAALAACVLGDAGDGVDGTGNGKRIVFADPAADTRAVPGHPVQSSETTIPDGTSFGVYAWSKPDGSSPLEAYASLRNMEVENDSGVYKYSPEALWPISSASRLGFLGYFPWVDQQTPAIGDPDITVTASSSAQSITIEYTASADPSEQVDLMYAATNLLQGFDPVQLNFRHALARLKFEAKTEDYPAGADVQITSIKIKDAVSKGELTVSGAHVSTAPVWTLDNTSKTDIVMTTSNGLKSPCSLTATLTDILVPGGDMLVLPQSITGMEAEISYKVGGVESPEPLVCPFHDSPNWKMNEIIIYEITITPGMAFITARVEDWDKNNNVGVIYDGQWWMSVTGDTFEFDAEDTETHTLTASTNYNIDTQGYPAGLQIDEAETEYTPAVASGSEWLTVTGGSNGDLSRTLTLTATAMSAPGTRTAKIKVRAGNLTKIINVTQSDPGIAPRFARSNIVWDGSKLTFAVTKEDNASIPADVQGLMFRWGSLFAISPVGTINAATSILHYPSGYTGTIPSGITAAAMAGIPYLDDTTSPPFDDAVSADDDFRYYNGNVGYDAATGKGDICRYITAQNWVEGSWRMPTAGEFTTLFSEKTAVSYGTAGTTTIPSGSNSYGTYEYGYYNSLFGFLAGVLATAEDSSSAPAYGAFFPASGRRNGDTGGSGASFANYFSYYWACSSGNDQAFSYASTSSPSTGAGGRYDRHWPQAIRCIRDDGEPLTPYTLTVDKDAVTLAADGSGSETVTATTDYTGGDPYYPLAGIQIDETEIVYDPAVASSDEWLTVAGGTNGNSSRTLTITAEENTEYEERSAYVKIKAGNLTRTIHVEQQAAAAPDAYEIDYGGTHLWIKKTDQPTTMWYTPANVADYTDEMSVPPSSGSQESPPRPGSCAEFVSDNPSKPWRLPTIEEFRNVIRFVEANGGNMSYGFNGGYPEYFTASSADVGSVHSITSNRPEGNIIQSKSVTRPSRCVRDY